MYSCVKIKYWFQLSPGGDICGEYVLVFVGVCPIHLVAEL